MYFSPAGTAPAAIPPFPQEGRPHYVIGVDSEQVRPDFVLVSISRLIIRYGPEQGVPRPEYWGREGKGREGKGRFEDWDHIGGVVVHLGKEGSNQESDE